MARISEMHYSNAFASSSGVDEFLEVALAPGETPADFTVGFYQANGTQGVAISLTHPDVVVTFDPQTNETTYVISADNFPIFLTDPDGGGSTNYEAYALVDTSSGGAGVVDFLDIGGGTTNITAVDGVAQGATSTNVPVPTGANASTYSIQFNQPNPDTPVYEDLSPGDTGIVCFASGTRIATPEGPRAVESLSAGDLVLTEDAGAQPLVWTGQRRVNARGPFAPIRFAPGSIGNTRALYLSPQHRVLITGWQAELLFGEPEVLVAACHLVNDQTIRRAPRDAITYHHILFDKHQLVRADGAPTESLFPGANARAALSAAARAELEALFPELITPGAAFAGLARPAARGVEGAVLTTLLQR